MASCSEICCSVSDSGCRVCGALLWWRVDKAAAARVGEVRRLQGELADARAQLDRGAVAETRLKADLAAARKQARSCECSRVASSLQ